MGDVLLQLENGKCELFLDVPWASQTRIVISYSSSAKQATVADAGRLFANLESRFAQICQGRQIPACGGQYHHTGHCMADRQVEAEREVNLLVVVEDSVADYDAATARTFMALPGAMILPVALAGSRAQPSSGYVTSIMTLYPAGRPESAVPEVLYAAQVGDDMRRVFISYRHADCAAIAAQVFHILAENRYAVFLDRFSGDPGHDFVGLILSELFDKGTLLVLEAENTHRSPWVRQETATALAHHLGIFKVNLAGSPDLLPADASIDFHSNVPKKKVGPTDTLSAAQLQQILAAFQTKHPIMAIGRRNFLAQTIDEAADYARNFLGATDKGRTQGLRHLARKSQKIGLTASARPPGSASFRHAANSANLAGLKGVLVGPLVHQLPGQGEVTDWLGRVSGVVPVDEGELLQTIGRLL